MEVLQKAKRILDSHGGFLPEDVLVSKLVNKNMFKFTRQELKLILVSDFDVSFLKRNRYINRSFYLEPLYEDLLTKMTLFIKDYFASRNKSQDLYEFI